jgi:hypothetical protein
MVTPDALRSARAPACCQVEGAQMGAGAARMQPAALWPQLDLLVGDVLAAAAWLAQDRHPGALPLPFAISCCRPACSSICATVCKGGFAVHGGFCDRCKSAVDYAVLTLVFLPVVLQSHDGAANVLAARCE